MGGGGVLLSSRAFLYFSRLFAGLAARDTVLGSYFFRQPRKTTFLLLKKECRKLAAV